MDKRVVLFVFLVIFPFGKLLSYGRMNLIDLVVGVGAIWGMFQVKKPAIEKKIRNVLLIFFVSALFSLNFFEVGEFLFGLLYLLRLGAYMYFFVYVWGLVSQKMITKEFVVKALIVVSLAAAVFGWIQYFWLPDLRALKEFGWDDHLYRLVGTFLDPAFTGIILVLGTVLARKRYPWVTLLLMVSVAFTYSRSSMLSLLVGFVLWGWAYGEWRKVVLWVLGFVVLVVALPRPGGHGVMLERTHSIVAKSQNYVQSLELAKKSPVLGIGFNNVCTARQKWLGVQEAQSHSCWGLDSSILFVLVTTGIVGMIVVFDFAWKLVQATDKIYWVLLACALVHSSFTNTLFYPWVMGWMGVLAGVVYRESD